MQGDGGTIDVAKIVSWGAAERRRGRVNGPRCGGSNLLALAYSRPGRLDPRDRPSSFLPHSTLLVVQVLDLYSILLLQVCRYATLFPSSP